MGRGIVVVVGGKENSRSGSLCTKLLKRPKRHLIEGNYFGDPTRRKTMWIEDPAWQGWAGDGRVVAYLKPFRNIVEKLICTHGFGSVNVRTTDGRRLHGPCVAGGGGGEESLGIPSCQRDFD